MFIEVQLLSGFNKPLTYKKPENLPDVIPGTIVNVPVRNTVVPAIVLKTIPFLKETTFTIKEIINIEKLPEDHFYLEFIKKLGNYYEVDPVYFITRIRSFIGQKQLNDDSLLLNEKNNTVREKILTQEQNKIITYIEKKITESTYEPILIHGVTGSGKTEIYKKTIEKAHSQNKTSIFLLPEVTLAKQFEKIFIKELPHIQMIAFHSATPPLNKKLLWQLLQEKKPVLIVGVHLPILLPINNLGVIIIDEEHEIGFQEKKHPKINTKSAALIRAQHYKIPIILGSATPSISSLYNVKHKGWKLFQLTKRFGGSFPTIKTVYLTDNKERKSFWITQELYFALKEQLLKKEQSIIFLNRRGLCFFLQCKNCAHIFLCKSCSVSLTLHDDNLLKCHYCSYIKPSPETCPECSQTNFLKKGIGTQQIVAILEKLFPKARIGRADMDTTTNKKVWQKTIYDFESHNLDILVGTQTITKGFHFPKVTLVGIIWADINLNLPSYNAKETILQQLIQVAGRAGRASQQSKVIMQVMTHNELFSYINEIDYLKFYDQEITQRMIVNYPPIIRFAEIELKHKKEAIVDQESFLVASLLIKNKKIKISGPSQPAISKIKNIFNRKIFLKSQNFNDLIEAFKEIKKDTKLRSTIFFTPDPTST